MRRNAPTGRSWDATDWSKCVRSRLERKRRSTSVRDEKRKERTRTDGPRLERQPERREVVPRVVVSVILHAYLLFQFTRSGTAAETNGSHARMKESFGAADGKWHECATY